MKLIIEDDEGRKTVVPFVRDEISIGRNEGNTIRLTERNVSRRHARFVRGSGHVFIEDLGSYNGVSINGDSVQGRAEVQEGDLIEIGDYNLAVQAEAGELVAAAVAPAPAREITSPGTQVPTTPAAPTAAPPLAVPPPAAAPPPAATPSTDHEPTVPTARAAAPAMELPEAHSADLDIPEPRPESTAIIKVDFDALGKKAQERQLEAGEQPSLVVISTEYAGQTYVLDRSLVSIGRTDENDIQLDHRSMSRKHCRIFLDEEGTWKVADLGSANGVRVNGEEYGLIEVRPGDFIELGHLKIRFCAPGEDYVHTAGADLDDGLAAVGQTEKVGRAPGGGLPLPMVIGGAALILMVAVGGIWAATSGGEGETSDPGGADTQPIVDPRAGNEIVPPDPDPAADPDPDPVMVDSGAALREAIQTASEAVERQDWPAAVTAYRKALSLEDSNAAAQAGLKQASLENEAHKSFQQGKDLLAEERFIEAAQRFDLVPPDTLLVSDAKTQATYARRRAAERLRSDARAAMGIKDYEGAITVAEAWLELNPRSREAQKFADRARAAQRKAAARPPAVPKPRPKRDPVVKKDPPRNDTKVQEGKAAQAKGVQFLQKGKFELAAKQFERALKIDPKGQGLTHKMLGICYARLGNKDLAAKHYRLYIKKNPSASDAAKVRQILSKYDASKGGGG